MSEVRIWFLSVDSITKIVDLEFEALFFSGLNSCQWIGLKVQETLHFIEHLWFPVDFPLNQSMDHVHFPFPLAGFLEAIHHILRICQASVWGFPWRLRVVRSGQSQGQAVFFWGSHGSGNVRSSHQRAWYLRNMITNWWFGTCFMTFHILGMS